MGQILSNLSLYVMNHNREISDDPPDISIETDKIHHPEKFIPDDVVGMRFGDVLPVMERLGFKYRFFEINHICITIPFQKDYKRVNFALRYKLKEYENIEDIIFHPHTDGAIKKLHDAIIVKCYIG